MDMFSHITLGVNNLEASIAFYDGVMHALGYECHSRGESFAGYGYPCDAKLGINSLWILTPINSKRASGGNGTNIAFNAPNRKTVREFHRVAIELGGTDEGLPGIREDVHTNFYAAYIKDLDGNKLVAVCHLYEQE